MTRTTIGLALLLGALSACSPGKAPPLGSAHAAAKLTERVFVIHGPNELPSKQNQGFMNNPGFVLTSKGVVVVDPGSSVQVGEMVLEKIRAVTKQPVIAVFNTHIHGDHWLGNQAIKAAYPNAVIYAHPNMIAKTAGAGADWLALFERLTEGATKGTRAVAPDMHIDHDETLALGDVHFRILHQGKAHTDGDIMIEVVEEKLMFLGDVVLHGRIGRMDDGHFLGNVAAIDLALKNGVAHFVPGHGQSGGAEVARAYRDYLAALHAEVKKLYATGLPDYDMKPKVVDALVPYKTWKEFDAEVGKHISLAYLQIEEEAF